MSVEKFVVGLVKEQVMVLIKKRVVALEVRVVELRRGVISGPSLDYLDGGITELEKLVLEFNALVEFSLVPEGGMVLSPLEVEVVEEVRVVVLDLDDEFAFLHALAFGDVEVLHTARDLCLDVDAAVEWIEGDHAA